MIDKSNPYFKQAELVGTVLPQIAKYDCFALKCGTAINLFVRNMPRLSVDIDLAYLPVQDRAASLLEVAAALERIASAIEARLRGSNVQRTIVEGQLIKLVAWRGAGEDRGFS